MRQSNMLTALVGLLILAGTGIGTAQATSITGNLWHVDEGIAQNAIPGNVPGRASDVTFEVNSPINFIGTNLTVGQWLASGSPLLSVSENTPGTLISLMDSGTIGTLVEFKGFVTVVNEQTFTVNHDDGLTLIIGSSNLGFNPGPTPPTTTTATYLGASGNLPFQLVYGECCQGPAVLNVGLPFTDAPSVPEPASLLLLGAGLAGIGIWRRKSTK